MPRLTHLDTVKGLVLLVVNASQTLQEESRCLEKTEDGVSIRASTIDDNDIDSELDRGEKKKSAYPNSSIENRRG
ncbi:unnamed protein product [Lasius platythorax]|uniref:Uncharacterized protein n=1 Tax=Lasius platythorax TaxID=488582 RepID=A0AAV2NCM5_9HYME